MLTDGRGGTILARMAIIRSYQGKRPVLGRGVYLADNATVTGDVELGEDSSIWFGCVLRGDVNTIRIGARTNIQDLTMVHVTGGIAPTRIGDEVTVGHGAVLHGCTVHDRVLVGMGAIVLDGAVLETDIILAAGAVVPPGTRLQSGYLYVGNPVKQLRALREADRGMIRHACEVYVGLAREYGKDEG